MLVTTDQGLMGDRAVSGPLWFAGWGITAIVTVLSLLYLAQQITGGGS
ncbi:hypothetical protein [Pseudonocardia sp.]